MRIQKHMDTMAVTGGAGFIGSNLAEFLLAQGYRVLIVDNFSTGREPNLAVWSKSAPDRIKILKVDVNETDILREAFAGVRYVFHQARYLRYPLNCRSQGNRTFQYQRNAFGPARSP